MITHDSSSPTGARSPAGSSATCRRLGIETVAVHSDADAGLPFVREADAAVRLPGNTPAETYLRGDLIVEAARRTGRRRGPPRLRLPLRERRLRPRRRRRRPDLGRPDPGVDRADGLQGRGQEADGGRRRPGARQAHRRDRHRGRPAAAGQGVRRRRRPRHARRPRPRRPGRARSRRRRAEAASAFGDGTVFVEPYVERGRHVEVQVFGDARRHGRWCSASGTARSSAATRRWSRRPRRPASPRRRATALHDAAAGRRRARSATSAPAPWSSSRRRRPTRFFFLEMNTRLQVEHPVTELRARPRPGRRCSSRSPRPGASPLAAVAADLTGHAIEVRLYAEDPAADWQPQSGTLTRFEIPGVAASSTCRAVRHPARRRLRVRRARSSTHYDAMLAKVDRPGADPRAGGPAARRRAGPGPDPRRGHQPRPAGRRPARRRRSWPAR